jgi:hypothetical protein
MRARSPRDAGIRGMKAVPTILRPRLATGLDRGGGSLSRP